jgi:hypothetical protein
MTWSTGLVFGPDNKIHDIQFFHTALLHALLEAHQQGWKDRSEAETLRRL